MMKKILLSILTITLLLLTGCALNTEPTSTAKPLPSMEKPDATPLITPEPAPKSMPCPTVIPTIMVLPPTEADIFNGWDDYIYMSPVSSWGYGAMVIKNDGSVMSWGEDVPQSPDYIHKPSMPFLSKVFEGGAVFVSCDRWQAMVIDADGALWHWGALHWIVEGIRNLPYHKKIMYNVQMASASTYSSLVLRKDGTIWVWGYGDYGVLGLGRDTAIEYKSEGNLPNPLSTPMKVMDDAIFIAGDWGHCLAIKSDNTLWAWGYIGIDVDPDDPYEYEPVYIMSDVKYASPHLAVKTDGTLWAYGKRMFYPDKEEPFPSYFTNEPVKIMDGVKLATNGYDWLAVIKEDGSLWVNWGDDTDFYKLMDNAVYVTSASVNSVYAVTADGVLWEAGLRDTAYNELCGDGRETTREELREAWVPHKIMDDVLVP